DKDVVDKAITMYDGVWCVNKKLVVKGAWGKKSSNRDWSPFHVQEPNMREKKPRPPTFELPTIEAENIHKEWLKLCAVGIVKEHTELGSIQAAMVSLGVHDIKIKSLGDNKALITFSDIVEKKAYLSS
ncbi:hypothetical protein U1Q18_008057, partial [Sarracenia purpurea var. burkii]